jgi:hypothetical protein
MVPRIDAELPLPVRRQRQRPRRRWKRPALAAAALALFPFATGYYVPFLPHVAGLQAPSGAQQPLSTAVAMVPDIAFANQLMPVSREEAERLNSARAADVRELVAARPFTVKDLFRDDPHFLSALDCLTQTIYYEADSEPASGQRAVAQVVLNRVRHPAFPHSICGVVYQGADLPTGCQFTFTCDGSLLRQPSLAGWARARKVALAALSGWVEAPVGLSTHYHANYVVPYWASSLDKVTLIGDHIFYAFRGPGGRKAAFHAAYDFANEFTPALAMAPVQAVPPADDAATYRIEPMPVLSDSFLAADHSASRVMLEADHSAAPPAQEPQLEADRQHGVLTARGADSTLKVD